MCKYEGCVKKVYCRGMCRSHYRKEMGYDAKERDYTRRKYREYGGYKGLMDRNIISRDKLNERAKKYRETENYKKYRENYYARSDIKERRKEWAHEYHRKPEVIERTRKRNRERLQNDVNFRISKILRRRLNHALAGKAKNGSAIRDLGCSLHYLITYIEARFLTGMTWDNHGFGDECWHIDHIIPLSSFDLTDPEQLKAACHYTNLQPLWQPDNFSKGARIA